MVKCKFNVQVIGYVTWFGFPSEKPDVMKVSLRVDGPGDSYELFELLLSKHHWAVKPFLAEGRLIMASGRARHTYFTRKDGSEGLLTKVAVNEIDFLDDKVPTQVGKMKETI